MDFVVSAGAPGSPFEPGPFHSQKVGNQARADRVQKAHKPVRRSSIPRQGWWVKNFSRQRPENLQNRGQPSQRPSLVIDRITRWQPESDAHSVWWRRERAGWEQSSPGAQRRSVEGSGTRLGSLKRRHRPCFAKTPTDNKTRLDGSRFIYRPARTPSIPKKVAASTQIPDLRIDEGVHAERNPAST